MSWKSIVCAGLLCALASPALAVPSIRVISDGLSGANQKWKVQVQPDGALLFNNPTTGGEGGALAVELDLQFSTAVISATKGAAWNNGAVLNPGFNPFAADAVASGIVVSGNTVFAALGSDIFQPFGGDTNADNVVNPADFSTLASNWQMNVAGGRSQGDFNNDGVVNPADFSTLASNWQKVNWIDALNVVTTGGGGNVNWGNRVVLDGTPDEFLSTRVAQGGQNFNGITGNMALGAGSSIGAIPEPSSGLLFVLGAMLAGAFRGRRS